ncbi:MAG: FAD-binding oxidoreductase [Gammaproteobacteria bacterium]|nr:MAG: FAD-binding oxidoreductase [Gammaproteobacteria bacterium]
MQPALDSDYPASWYTATARGLVAPEPLQESLHADVCVIGGGYTGLSAALHLRRQGAEVVLLEARRAGWGASGRNGGQIGSGQRREESELEHLVGQQAARELWQLAEDAKTLVRELVARYRIACDLAEGQLIVAAKPQHALELARRAERLAAVYGYERMRFLDRGELRQRLATDAYHGGILDRGAMHLHPLNYALGLARACREAGVRLCEGSPALGYTRSRPARVETPQGEVRADELVLACNGYLQRLEPRLAGYIMPLNNFIVATEPLADPAALIAGNVCVHDTRFVVNYFRLSPDGRLLFGGGENYRRRFPRDIAAFVRPVMLEIFPQLARSRIDYAWGGTLAITLNRLPQLGRLEPNLWYAQGFSGHGVSIGTLAGQLLAEAIAGRRQRFDRLATLPARRFPGGTLLRWPGMVAGMLYYALRDRL